MLVHKLRYGLILKILHNERPLSFDKNEHLVKLFNDAIIFISKETLNFLTPSLFFKKTFHKTSKKNMAGKCS